MSHRRSISTSGQVAPSPDAGPILDIIICRPDNRYDFGSASLPLQHLFLLYLSHIYIYKYILRIYIYNLLFIFFISRLLIFFLLFGLTCADS